MGRLGLTSPPSPVLCSAEPVLSLSKGLPLARLGVLCSRSFTDTLFALYVRVLSSSSLEFWSVTLTPGLLGHPVRLFRVSDKETTGSPKPALSLSKGSQVTPLSSCPALRPRWCPEHSPLAHPGLLPSTRLTVSAFPLIWRLSYRPRLYKFRGSITRPVLSLPLASDACYQVYPQGSLLTCWLDFSQVGFAPTR